MSGRRRRSPGGAFGGVSRVRLILTAFLVLVFFVPTTVIILAYPVLVQDIGDLGRELRGVQIATRGAMAQSRDEVAQTVAEARGTVQKVTRMQLIERTRDLANHCEEVLEGVPAGGRTVAQVVAMPALRMIHLAALPGHGRAMLVDPKARRIVIGPAKRRHAPFPQGLAQLLDTHAEELAPFLTGDAAPKAQQAAGGDADDAPKPSANAAPKAAPGDALKDADADADAGEAPVVSNVTQVGRDTRIWLVSPVHDTRWVVAVNASLTEATSALLGDIPTALRQSQAEVGRSLSAIDGTVASFQAHRRRLQRFLTDGLLAGGFLAFLVVAIALAVVDHQVVRPIRDVVTVTERVSAGDYQSRILVQVGGELGELGRAVNDMLDRIVGLIESDEDEKRLQAHIMELLEQVSRASDGDLTARGEVTDDVLGAVVDGLNLMLESIGSLIVQVRSAGQEVTGAAEAIRAAQLRVDAGAAQQSRRLDAAADHVLEVATSMRTVAEAAGSAADAARDATRAATRGASAVGDTVEGMHAIRQDTARAARRMKELGDKSLEINTIVELIDDLAAQTNMLALNAAIEASRAGEQGQGFGIVAESVRKLAERSSAAAGEISGLIEGIQAGAGEAMTAMDEVRGRVEAGVRLADDAGRALADIQTVVQSATGLIEGIHAAAAAEAEGAGRLADAIEEIRRVASEAADEVRLTTQAVDDLQAQSRGLAGAMERFRVAEPVGQTVTRALLENRAELQASVSALAGEEGATATAPGDDGDDGDAPPASSEKVG